MPFIEWRILGRERNRDRVHVARQLRRDVTPMDQVGEAIGIEAYPAAALFDRLRDLEQDREPLGRFAQAAKYDFVIACRITQCRQDFFTAGFALERQVIGLHHPVAIVFGTKPTT